MTKITLDTIVGSGKVTKADYYVKDYVSPPKIENAYNRIYDVVSKMYDTSKFMLEYAKNLVFRK